MSDDTLDRLGAHDDVFNTPQDGIDFPTEPAAETAPEPVEEAAPAPDVTPEAPEAPQPSLDDPTQPPQTPAPEQDAFGRAMAEMRRDFQSKIEERERQLAWAAQQLQQLQQPAPEQAAAPDPFEDPDGYREHVRQSVIGEIAPALQQMQYQQANLLYSQSLQMAAATVGTDQFGAYKAACEQFAAQYPGIVQDIQTSDNPGLRIIELGKMLEGQKAAPIDREALKEELRREMAAELAKQGATPQAPRGVGTGPAGSGRSDALPPPSDYRRLAKSNPGEWDRVKDSVFNS